MSKDLISYEIATPSPSVPRPVNGSRVAIALACWLLSSVGVLVSLMAILSVFIAALLTKPLEEVLQSGSFYFGLGVAYAWTALAVMTAAWISNKQLAWHWPLLGGMAGMICSAVFMFFIPLILPCFFLGLYLVYFHLAGYVPSVESAV